MFGGIFSITAVGYSSDIRWIYQQVLAVEVKNFAKITFLSFNTTAVFLHDVMVPVSSEISDLCEISYLLLLVSYFASQSKGIRFRDDFFDVYCVNQNFLIRCQTSTTSYSTGITITTKNIGLLRSQLFFFFEP